MANVIVLGGGSWGLSIANMLHHHHHHVKVWEINDKHVEELISTRSSSKFLPGIHFDSSVKFSSLLEELFAHSLYDMIILAIPSQFVRETIRKISIFLPQQTQLKAIVNLAKGLEIASLKRMSEVISEELSQLYRPLISTLSGPSHAEEVAREIPTAVVLAGNDQESIKYVQKEISNKFFRIYTSSDLTGVEIGGVVKNIIAIAAGIIDGLGFGDNTKGALLTRGMAEIKRLGLAMNAQDQTFQGLSGIGDLITTAISTHSRNRYVGMELGKGRNLPDILSGMSMVAEGVNSTKAIWELKEKLHIEMPITDQIYKVLFEHKDPKKALIELMTRNLKDED